ARGEEDRGHVVLVPTELLADDVHPRDEALEDERLRVEGEVEPLPGLARNGVLVADDQRARHRRIVEALAAHAPILLFFCASIATGWNSACSALSAATGSGTGPPDCRSTTR